jgi:hypothetical protein
MGGEYLAFLLRLQRSQGQTEWRASMQNAKTGEILRFATERELLHYLIQILSVAPPGLLDSREADNKSLE